MTTSQASSSRQPPDPKVSIQAIEQTFPTLDANRATGYAQLGQLRSAKSASLAREQKFLIAKHGKSAQAHPRIQYAGTALLHNEQFRRELAAAQEIVETPAPQTDAKSFVVYGFVRRKDQTGVSGVSLALTDAQGNWQREFGYACTDSRGYFLLRVGRPDPDKIDRDPDDPAQPPPGTGNPRAPVVDRELQLRIFNREGRVLHVETRPVVLRVDTLDYRLIILDNEDGGCTPPPEKSTGQTDPKNPRVPSSPPPAPTRPASSGPAAARVAALKEYRNPSATTATSGGTSGGTQPLEAIRGIGPKGAERLRRAGIEDLAEFSKTEGAALVRLAGFDKNQPTARAKEKPSAQPTKPADAPAAKTPVSPRPVRAPAKAAPEKKSIPAPTKKKSK